MPVFSTGGADQRPPSAYRPNVVIALLVYTSAKRFKA
jgi:hypothetical protein